ncbi:hypothetical protein BEP19_16160 [Ammoniphilus oxalaticus]|uniref:PNPLA domain-containing protein n=1 Tax=Ammoniphilus oxalaticus TaxID=66863 RepID=A0A419SQG9_9BACL|nr:patatin-like phospholipase family protein [Ammoniphilus oxalaticus]RKD26734.1 hypothetical protein BEP19_16160 [Ammoniphilus oxalaticus]
MKADAVFEGGGIKGLAFLGAVEVMEEAGYQWERLAGTSAGSIIAALLATGMSGKQIVSAFLSFPFHKLEVGIGLNRIPYLGPYLCLRMFNGLHSLDLLQQWLETQFIQTGKIAFGDLPDQKLKIVVTDVTRNKMSIIPDDLPSYGVDPNTFPLAAAVRMSCSVPFFFRPTFLENSLIVDGGVLSNYPVWIFDSKERPKWPTFGFRLSGAPLVAQPQKIKGPIRLGVALIRTMLEGQGQVFIDAHSAARTITVKGIPYAATDFRLTNTEKEELVQLGRDAAVDFLIRWNFEQYVSVYRQTATKMKV